METLAKLEELEQKFGENPRRYFAALANEYRKNGEFEQAIELCRAQLEQQPEHLSGRVVLGQALFDAFRYDEAREELTTAIQLDPENFIALRLLGELAAQDGDQETAREFFSRARDIEPRNEQLLAALAALGPVEPPVTLAAAVARTATKAAEPVAEPVTEAVGEPAAGSVSELVVEPVVEPVIEPTVERFAESAFAPSAASAAPIGGAAPAIGAAAEQQPASAATAEPAPEPAPQPVVESVTEGPPRRERPASRERERRPKVQRVEGLMPTTLAPEEVAEPQTGAPAERVSEIETEPAAIEAQAVEPQMGARTPGPELSAVETLTPPEPRTTIVTETMADLYLEQGHRDEAVEVLRQLVSQRPDDERLTRRLADLEAAPAVSTVRDFFARLATRGGVAPPPVTPAANQSTGSLAAVFGDSGSTLLDPESAALIAVTLPEPTATPTADEFENWVGRRRKP